MTILNVGWLFFFKSRMAWTCCRLSHQHLLVPYDIYSFGQRLEVFGLGIAEDENAIERVDIIAEGNRHAFFYTRCPRIEHQVGHDLCIFGDERCLGRGGNGQLDVVGHGLAAFAGGQHVIGGGEHILAKLLDVGCAGIAVAVSGKFHTGDGDAVGDVDLVVGIAGVFDSLYATTGALGIAVAYTDAETVGKGPVAIRCLRGDFIGLLLTRTALLNGDTPYFAFTNFFLTLYANPQYSIINQLTPGSDDYKQSVAIYNAWLSWLKKVQELKANGKLKGVIIDLRSNGGGMFYDFGLVLGSLFQPGTDLQVGYHRYKRGPGRYDYSPLMPDTRPGIDIVELLPNEPSVQNIQQQGITEPIVVLTNCMSVSMAEMTAMGAKAMPNARVIGKRTFGGLCGLVGNESASYNYSGHIGIMGKTAVYCYTPTVATIQPDGKTILEGIGVTPDIEVNYVVTPAGTDRNIRLWFPLAYSRHRC